MSPVCPSWRRGGDGGDGDYEDEDEEQDEDEDTIGSTHDPLGGRRVRSEVSALEEVWLFPVHSCKALSSLEVS